MSVENARKFVEKIKSDDDFSSRLNNAKTKEERLKIAADAGLEFTREEYKAVRAELPVWTMDDWLAARRAYDQFETSWLAMEFSPWHNE